MNEQNENKIPQPFVFCCMTDSSTDKCESYTRSLFVWWIFTINFYYLSWIAVENYHS